VAFAHLQSLDARTTPPYAFGYFGEAGAMGHYKGRECYRYMMEFHGAKALYAVFVHANGAGEAEKLLYVDWLLDKTCVWADIVERQRKMFPVAWNSEFIVNHGYFVPDLNIASNWLLDFLMASRVSGEFPAFLPIWSMLVENGVDPRVAMNFGLRFIRTRPKEAEAGYMMANANNSNHFPFYIHVKCFDNFCQGNLNVKKLRQPFSQNPIYTPVQVIWGASDDDDYAIPPGLIWDYTFLKAQHPKLIEEVKTEMRESQFGKASSTTIYSKALLIKIALAEQARLKITDEAATDFLRRCRPGSYEGLPEERKGVRGPDGGNELGSSDVQAERVPDSPDAGAL